MDNAPSSTRQKALAVNFDAKAHDTFAEIGGGQEVARWFFSVGGAARTVAKTISAYDMAVSNAIYGSTERYVSRQRLEAMLKQEFVQVVDLLGPRRGDDTSFFAFANTVATSGRGTPGRGRGWVGVRFQTRPHEEPSEIIVHAHLLDSTAVRQQDALGVLGVNLIYGDLLPSRGSRELDRRAGAAARLGVWPTRDPRAPTRDLPRPTLPTRAPGSTQATAAQTSDRSRTRRRTLWRNSLCTPRRPGDHSLSARLLGAQASPKPLR